jgi:hypothetical protein
LLFVVSTRNVEYLSRLRTEFDDINSRLEFPFSMEEFLKLKDRRRAILAEAIIYAKTEGILGSYWFNTAF